MAERMILDGLQYISAEGKQVSLDGYDQGVDSLLHETIIDRCHSSMVHSTAIFYRAI